MLPKDLFSQSTTSKIQSEISDLLDKGTELSVLPAACAGDKGQITKKLKQSFEQEDFIR